MAVFLMPTENFMSWKAVSHGCTENLEQFSFMHQFFVFILYSKIFNCLSNYFVYFSSFKKKKNVNRVWILFIYLLIYFLGNISEMEGGGEEAKKLTLSIGFLSTKILKFI